MAWGSWTQTSTTVASGSRYKIIFYWAYRQDRVTNQTEVSAEHLQIQATTAYNLQASSITYGGYPQGASAKTTTKTSVTINGNSSLKLDFSDVHQTYTHGSDGKLSKKLYWYLKSSFTPSGFPSYTQSAWQSFTPAIPAIDRTAPSASISSVSTSYSTLTVKASTNCAGVLYARIGTSGSWTKIASDIGTGGGSATHTFTGLKHATRYTVQVYAYRSWNGTASSIISKTATTKTVPAPSVPVCTAKTENGQTTVTMTQGGTVYDETTKLDGVAGALNLCLYADPPATEWPTFTYREYMTISDLRAGYVIQSDLSTADIWGFRVYTNAPVSNAKDFYQGTFRIGSDGYLYIKTTTGWAKGTPYIKTATGWAKGTPYIKTSTGWKKTA